MPDREFFRQDALTLARTLVGKLIVRSFPDGSEKRLRISETEAYCGVEDTACHAHKGKTKRGNYGFLRTLEPGKRNHRIRRCVNSPLKKPTKEC